MNDARWTTLCADRKQQTNQETCHCTNAGHSLGGFTAACSAIFFKDILRVTTFESPGLTSFYHSLARQGGCKDYWQQRVVNYLSVPNPINTCQRHLGLMIR